MNKQEQLEIVKEFAEKLINSQKDTTPEFEKIFGKNYRKLLARFDENVIPTPEPKPVKECYICHKAINDGISTTHASWSIYCSDCVLAMKV